MAVLLLICALASLLVCLLVLVYARWRGLLDMPGQRRSHSVPTPRGGGLGPVLVLLLLLPLWLTELGLGRGWAALVTLGALALAVISFVDDHRDLSPWLRLSVHLAVAMLVVGLALQLAPGLAWYWLALLFLAVAWSINLHNFMDGSNGLLGLQLVWVFACYALLARHAQDPQLLWYSLCGLVAVAAFLPLNFPRASMFMGDVGSASLGLLLAIIAIVGWLRELWSLPMLLVIHSAFVIDATLTLLSRVAAGRRWYSAHREHLYQWYLRRGDSHARVAMRYSAWNLLLCVPVLLLMLAFPDVALLLAIILLCAAALLWRGARVAMLRTLRKGAH